MHEHADKIDISGVIIGFIALAIVLFQFYYGPINKTETSLLGSTKIKIQTIFSGNQTSKESSVFSDVDVDNALTYASILFAFLAVVAGTVAYIRNDKKKSLTQACQLVLLRCSFILY